MNKGSKIFRGFWNFDFLWVGGDNFRQLCRHVHQKKSAHVDGWLSRGFRVRRPRSEDPHQRERKLTEPNQLSGWQVEKCSTSRAMFLSASTNHRERKVPREKKRGNWNEGSPSICWLPHLLDNSNYEITRVMSECESEQNNIIARFSILFIY